MSVIAGLIAAAVIQGPPPPEVCRTDFHWSDSDRSVSVMPASDLVRIELPAADRRDREGERAGRLILTASDDGLVGPDEPWAPVNAGLSLTPPGTAVDRGVWESRVRLGPRGPAQSPSTRIEIYPVQDRPYFEAWVDFQRWTPAGGRAVDRFREGGEVTAELWRRGAARPVAAARFDWSDVEALVQRARVHYAGCPAG